MKIKKDYSIVFILLLSLKHANSVFCIFIVHVIDSVIKSFVSVLFKLYLCIFNIKKLNRGGRKTLDFEKLNAGWNREIDCKNMAMDLS